MYRQGVGDAFLLSFHTGRHPAHILIDCGVLTGTPAAKTWSQRIARDVDAETGGHLNAIVGTHPHWDHLSGFHDARDLFKKIKVDEVWLSWAENPHDPGAAEKKHQRALQLDAVRRALTQLATAPDAATRRRAAAVEEILWFHGPAVSGAGAPRGTDAALAALRGMVQQPRFWEPGDLITPDWLTDVRIYVLAPPRDEKLLSKMLGKVGSEMYGLGSDTGLYAALLERTVGADAIGAEARSQIEATRPFEADLCWSAEQARGQPGFAAVLTRYEAPENGWRTIDHEWLMSAEQLALQLDNVINNLSLVLAFELTRTGEVLLFTADAQIGNWLSWQTLTWTLPENAGEKKVQTRDLLARTVFYKVGHHGSHNATLMSGGLEAMMSPDLVGAISVNQAFANGTKKWDMPAKPLYPHLLERTRGRLLRSDGAGPTATDPRYQPDDPNLWRAFAARVVSDTGDPPLYVDYHLP
jgi:hypothetical protein